MADDPAAVRDRPHGPRAQTDPLPSWNDGPAKQSILKFVQAATDAAGPQHVPPAARIAVFDNDGTLWSEQPMYFQGFFAFDRVKALAPKHPEWKTKQPFKGILENDMKAVAAAGEKGLFEVIAATHAGMTTDEFAQTVKEWVARAKHPRFQRPYTDLVYQPMLELLAYLRANGFKTFIVSGGGVEFMRVFAEEIYGIPPEQIVGSVGETKLEVRNGKPVLVKLPKRSTWSTTRQASRSGSTGSSGAARSWPSATRTGTTRCSSGRRPATGCGSWVWSVTRMRSGSGRTTASPRSGGSTRRWTRRPRGAGRLST
jgi:phosphoglycolate phosphatase-like HAD superfamily hydrolase